MQVAAWCAIAASVRHQAAAGWDKQSAVRRY